MSEEQMQILQMVANGKITAAEANQLLQAIARADAKAEAQESFEGDFEWPEMPEMPKIPPFPAMPNLPNLPKMPFPPPSPRRGTGRSGRENRLKSYGNAMKAAGFDFSDRELRSMQHHVTVEFAQALRDAGVTDLNGRELTEMAIHGVRPRFIREARELGLDLNVRELVEMHIHGISIRFIRKAKELGLDNLNARELVEMGIHNVDLNLMSTFKAIGMHVNAREMVDLSIHSVTPSLVQAINGLGLTNLTVR
ncbi:MAG: hypothetical protein KDE28_24690, partial [Anaerolineales bacterium]|nr:hypothetical protein [Anaerolineales bacterium]